MLDLCVMLVLQVGQHTVLAIPPAQAVHVNLCNKTVTAFEAQLKVIQRVKV